MDQNLGQDKEASGDPAMEQEMVLDRLNAIGKSLAKTRAEAISGRASCGIEAIWREDEEHYEGIDDKNRGAQSTAGGSWNTKPPGQSTAKSSKTESIEFPNITRPYVDAAASRVCDIILPTDERPWTLKPTPIPDLLAISNGALPQEVADGMKEAGVPQETQDKVLAIEQAEADKKMLDAEQRAKRVEKRIEDWMVEGQWHSEMRKVIHECARLGSGVIKGPLPKTKQAMIWKDAKLTVIKETKPISRKLSVWNFYPDPACGESIHNGGYTWEVDFITERMLIALKEQLDEDGSPDYIPSQIDLCVGEGPKHHAGQRKTADGKGLHDDKLYEIWYYYGFASREDLETAGCRCPDDGTVSIPAFFTMVNDRVIKAAISPLDSGEFPYDVLPWKVRQNLPWGCGVSREMRPAQRIVTAATRVMLTNAGRSAGPVFVRKRGAVVGADGNDDVTPWKMFDALESEVEDVNKVFTMFEIPDRQKSLQAIIQYGMKLAEDSTGLAMLLQGQVGSAPDTLGGQQMAERNSAGVLRRMARQVDDCITEPHLRRYYAYFLLYGPDEEKGDYIIDARGSTDLVERELYRNEVQVMLQASLNGQFGLDPVKVMAEHLRITKKSPDKFQFTEQEKRQKSEEKPPEEPAVTAAKIRAEAMMAIEKERSTTELAIADKHLQERIMEFAEMKGLNLDQIKANLAELVMKLRTQVMLSSDGHSHDLHKTALSLAHERTKDMQTPELVTPPVEPPGRAAPGKAFTQ